MLLSKFLQLTETQYLTLSSFIFDYRYDTLITVISVPINRNKITYYRKLKWKLYITIS